MPLYLKFCITILALILTFVTCREIKDRRKRIIVTMAILLAISTFSNRSIYWFIYWDGPYFGQVVDADTGEPIEGASVAGVWQFEGFILLIASLTHFATAKETVTDAEGKFTIPLTSIWPPVVKEKTSPMDRNNQFLSEPLPSLFSDPLTSNSLVPACVFGRERQRVWITRLHQTSIRID
ncbi:hypothetical protein DSCA_61250 [Desulfosarcina alkanivorans]|uniref:Carboxypeptidase regulatory-like domain-containing protein n=1 Tax=Desulfosarcina alkanivorans TaxID=571177 RepID=A0A5K7YUW3_9BACT|nr:hypothetical protein [Desulfosarcina alkanivorans]BBO72195.1 hypothetical protein DSCA_61250 [Desulfosarcina alkanivorans]